MGARRHALAGLLGVAAALAVFSVAAPPHFAPERIEPRLVPAASDTCVPRQRPGVEVRLSWKYEAAE